MISSDEYLIHNNADSFRTGWVYVRIPILDSFLKARNSFKKPKY